MAEYTEKRRHVRYTCDIGVEIRTGNAGAGYWGTLADISSGGCYINTFSPLPLGTSVVLLIKTSGTEVNARGKVVSSHPGVGMGIEFQGFIAQHDEEQFNDLIGSLARAATA